MARRTCTGGLTGPWNFSEPVARVTFFLLDEESMVLEAPPYVVFLRRVLLSMEPAATLRLLLVVGTPPILVDALQRKWIAHPLIFKIKKYDERDGQLLPLPTGWSA